jgi:hypothetical protein
MAKRRHHAWCRKRWRQKQIGEAGCELHSGSFCMINLFFVVERMSEFNKIDLVNNCEARIRLDHFFVGVGLL